MGKGALDDRSLLSLPAVGVQARDSMTAGLDEADVVVCVGYDLVEFGPAAWNGDRRKRIVHVDARAAEVDADYIPEVELVGDVARDPPAAARGAAPRAGAVLRHPPARRRHDGAARDRRARPASSAPSRPSWRSGRRCGPSDILISDVGAHKLWLGRLFPAYEPNTVIISNGFATMGIGLPGAIAAALAQPERRAVTVSGDGGFMMNVQEMETATRLGLPVVVVVWVDGAYGVIGWKQERRFGRTYAIEFGNPALGGPGRLLRLEPPPRDRRRRPARRARGRPRRERPGPGHGADRLPPERPPRQPWGARARRLAVPLARDPVARTPV